MKVFCKKTYICNKTKKILYTNKQSYDSIFPNRYEKNVIYIWIKDNNNEWSFFSKKDFDRYFENIETRRNNIINELLN